jgi:Phytanoyl-CoA dioxygenase (PhyH)
VLTDEQRYLFDLRGYLVVPGVLAADTVAGLNKVIDEQELPPPGETFNDQIFSGFLGWGLPFAELLDHPATMPLLNELLVRPRLDRYYGIRMRADTTGLPLHGGALEADDQSEYYWFRNGRMGNGVITVSWALTDMLPGQGGFVCVPGSHKSNYSLPEDWDYRNDGVVHLPLSAGDVLIFNGAIVHGTHPWQAEHERRSLLFKYAPGQLAWSRLYLNWSPELLESLSPSRRSLLEPPYCLPHHADATDRFVN